MADTFLKDPERLARFDREARLLASLNHPNIATLYGMERTESSPLLVMELVEGETIGELLKRGPISIEESLKLALQIAEALEAAHEKGVIHRDLKPANIKVTPDGKVKVLDFGLAKAFAAEQEVNLSNSPTLSDAATQQGVILGTAAYMSPEQARGKAVDKRADIWAFGCVLFEMLTGRAAFSGRDVTEILAAVIRSEPDWRNLPANLHWRLRELLERCLDKEAKDRYSGINDARVDIQKALADPSGMLVQPVAAAEPQRKLKTILPWAATILVLGLIIGGVVVWKFKPAEPRQVMRTEYDPPKDQQLGTLAVSPDGKQFVYSTPKGLYMHSLGEFDSKLIVGTETNPFGPFFSPDGKWVGYWSRADRKLKKIATSGGAPATLCDASLVIGASWGVDDTIVYGNYPNIMRVSANGGTPEVIVKGVIGHPQLLPDGKSLLFTIRGSPFKIAVQSLKSGERKELFAGDTARYVSTGYIVYGLENNLLAVPFNLKTLQVTGGSIPVVVGVWRPTRNDSSPAYAVSDSGTLVYMPGMTGRGNMLVWVDRNGNEEPLAAPPDHNYNVLQISPDGTRVAVCFYSDDTGTNTTNILDLAHMIMTRITFDPAEEDCPVWAPDNKRIAFVSQRKGSPGIYIKSADGAGSEELFIPLFGVPGSWSRDGKTLFISGGGFIGALSMGKDHKGGKLFKGDQPRISPNGRWLAYTSKESGRNEIYVRPYPEVEGGKQQVSASGGDSALWRPDGRELFYRNGDEVMAVSVKADQPFSFESPKPIFRGTYASADWFRNDLYWSNWDISHDGKRFLMIKEASATEGGPRKINIVLNWLEELKQQVPTK